MADPVWHLNGVTLGGRERPRLDDVSLQILPGVTAIMGCSGAGKSSLLGLLTGFEEPNAGTVQFTVPDSSHSLPLFWSPQDHGLWPHLTVEQHVDYVLSRKAGEPSVIQWLELFGLEELSGSLPDTLSQGERSRLAIARALASDASVLVLDEPLVHVDPLSAHRYWQVIGEHIQRRGTTVVFSTHDPDAVLKYATNVVCLNDGQLNFSGAVESLYYEPPSRELAWLLGPCNWLLPADFAKHESEVLRAGEDHDEPRCVRPFQLEITIDSDGPFTVDARTKAASVTELRLRQRNSTRIVKVFVPRLSRGINVGDDVVLTVRAEARSSDNV